MPEEIYVSTDPAHPFGNPEDVEVPETLQPGYVEPEPPRVPTFRERLGVVMALVGLYVLIHAAYKIHEVAGLVLIAAVLISFGVSLSYEKE